MSDKTPGQRAYEAYWRGMPNELHVPAWFAIKDPLKKAGWERAAAAVMPQRDDGLTPDERDVWKAAYGSAVVLVAMMAHEHQVVVPDIEARKAARDSAALAVDLLRQDPGSVPIEVSAASPSPGPDVPPAPTPQKAKTP